MKRTSYALGSLVAVLLCFCCSAAGIALADEATATAGPLANPAPEQALVSVEDFGADGSDDKDDAPAFVAALATARTTSGTTEVRVPAGTYYLGRSVPIFSNTTLQVDPNATIISRAKGGIMIFSRHLNDEGNVCTERENCTHAGYTQIENVTIDGGIWDANYSVPSDALLPDAQSTGAEEVFQFRHGRNITIRNTICRNAPNHFINISGVHTALIDNVVFEDMAEFKGPSSTFWGGFGVNNPERYTILEALHVDYLDARGESKAFPHDGSPTVNLKVSNCTFRNVFAGIGTHQSSIQDKHATNIEIDHNLFQSVKSGKCISAYGFKDLFVHHNQAWDGSTFLFCDECTGCGVINNEISAMGENSMLFSNGSEATVRNNVISDVASCGIRVTGGCNLTIESNELGGNGQATYGIVLADNSTGSVIDNVIREFAQDGIAASDAPNATICDNAIVHSGDNGIAIADCLAPQVNNNTVNTAAGIGIFVKASSSAYVSNNIVSKSTGDGIRIRQSDNATIQHNETRFAEGAGLKVIGSLDAVVDSNTISESMGNGIEITGNKERPANAQVIGNASLSTKVAENTYDIRLGSYCNSCDIRNNIVGPRGFSAHESVEFLEENTRTGMSTDISGCTVTLLNDTETFMGSITKPSLDVKYHSATLVEGTDYVVSSTFDMDSATAEATITGSGCFTGTKTVTYKLKLATPILNSATNVDNGIEVAWTGPNGAELYCVMRKEADGAWEELATTTDTTYIDVLAAPDKEYSYTVRCLTKDATGYMSDYDANGILATDYLLE